MLRDPGGVEAGALFVVMTSLRCRVKTPPGRSPGAVWGCLGLFGAVVGAVPGAAPTF